MHRCYQTLDYYYIDKLENLYVIWINFFLLQNENPGPGSYVGHVTYRGKPESSSKKGYGGFVSKNRRLAKTQVPSGPGAGKYQLPNVFQSKSDFNKANTGNFHQPIAQPHGKHPVLPSPTSYEVSDIMYNS